MSTPRPGRHLPIEQLTESPPPVATLKVAPAQVLDSTPIGNATPLFDTITLATGGRGRCRGAPRRGWAPDGSS